MQSFLKLFPLSILSIAAAFIASSPAMAVPKGIDSSVEKEWTLLVFLNGHNNLDSFGFQDLNEMEKVGSTDQVNVVVQWASSRNSDTRRLLVRRDADSATVTSPVVQSLPRVDMGDVRNLVEFVRWGMENYPAKRYFIDVWDHGSGWHKSRGDLSSRDISWDDHTGSYITTEQLGDAMRAISGMLGRKVDLYGSDACLMAMAEVAGEMSDSVAVSVGAEEVEPGAGWPYDKLLERWTARPSASAAEVATILTEVYLASYTNGSQGNASVTLSAFDLEKSDLLHSAVRSLADGMRSLGLDDRRKVAGALRNAQHFTYSDYGDLVDMLGIIERSRVAGVDARVLADVRSAVGQYVISNKVSPSYSRAHGVAIWTPSSKYRFSQYRTRYTGLAFHQATGWGDALAHVLQDQTN